MPSNSISSADRWKSCLLQAAKQEDGFVVSTADPRIVDGKPTKNPRYLQDRPDMVNARDTYVAMRGIQLRRCLPADAPVHVPVGAVLSGRRNNPPDPAAGFRSLAVYSPLHYQELPELLMDYVCSLTGKSPSTTGAGSEGALTKGPFNALLPSIDLNAIVTSMILTELGGFSTPAGHIGPRFEVGHDISLLIPEVWCRMGPEERDPKHLIESGMLEQVKDFEAGGVPIPASRLGYRITVKFVRRYLGRVFDNPSKVFTDDILKPELQDPESFADGILHIAEAQRKVALLYMEDGGYEAACPPLRAVLSIMAYGNYEGKEITDPEVRDLFTRESLLASDWYRRRLEAKQRRDIEHWKDMEQHVSDYMNDPSVARLHRRTRSAQSAAIRSGTPGRSGVSELLGIACRYDRRRSLPALHERQTHGRPIGRSHRPLIDRLQRGEQATNRTNLHQSHESHESLFNGLSFIRAGSCHSWPSSSIASLLSEVAERGIHLPRSRSSVYNGRSLLPRAVSHAPIPPPLLRDIPCRFQSVPSILFGMLVTVIGDSQASELNCPPAVTQFLQSNCVDCHEGDEAEAGLDLSKIDPDLGDAKSLQKWIRLFDRVADGEMPPADYGELEPQQRQTFLAEASAWISETQQQEFAEIGRVRSRRLNNLQLERTLHDLLAIDVPLADFMPEEQRTDGFNSIADGQSMSHFLLESHLKVVDAALDAAMQRVTDDDDSSRDFTARQLARENPRQRCRDPEMIDDKAVVWSSGLIFYGRITSTTVKESGWYRISFSASAVNRPKEHGVWCSVRSGRCTSGAPLLAWIGSFEATDEPTEHIMEAWIPEGHMLEIRPADATLKRAKFQGGQVGAGEGGPQNVPGVALHSMRIEEIHPGGDVKLVQRRLFGEMDIDIDRRHRSIRYRGEPTSRGCRQAVAGIHASRFSSTGHRRRNHALFAVVA